MLLRTVTLTATPPHLYHQATIPTATATVVSNRTSLSWASLGADTIHPSLLTILDTDCIKNAMQSPYNSMQSSSMFM